MVAVKLLFYTERFLLTRTRPSFTRFLQGKKRVAHSLSFGVSVDTMLIIIKVNITVVQVYVAVRVGNFHYFPQVQVNLDYPIDSGP